MKRTSARNALEAAVYLLLSAFLLTGAPALRAQRELSEKLVRLHVVAHSDAPADQARKLAVRDAVAAEAAARVSEARTAEEAAAALEAALPDLAARAAAVLRENSWEGPVYTELTETEFPTRTYDGFALPAGRYQALRIVIGDGKGRNWWCVVFPPLCGGIGMDTTPEAAFTAEELRLVTPEEGGYTLKFRTVELWGRLRQAFS